MHQPAIEIGAQRDLGVSTHISLIGADADDHNKGAIAAQIGGSRAPSFRGQWLRFVRSDGPPCGLAR
jgi:hypothetical protein